MKRKPTQALERRMIELSHRLAKREPAKGCIAQVYLSRADITAIWEASGWISKIRGWTYAPPSDRQER